MRPLHTAAALALLSLVLRLALVPYHASRPLVSDFLVYASDAERIAKGQALLDDPGLAARAPVYPVFLAGVFSVFGRSLAAAYAIQALLWSASGFAVWSLARQPLGEGGALAATGLYLFHPDGVVASGLTCVESLGAVLVTVLLLRVSRMSTAEQHPAVLLADGLLAGAAVLTAVPLLLFVVLALAAATVLRRRRGLRILPLLLVAAGMGVAIAPWAARNARAGLGFSPLTTISGTALLGGNNPEARGEWNEEYVLRERARFAGSELEWNAFARRKVASFLLEAPGRWLLVEGLKLVRYFSPKPGGFYRGRLLHPWIELAASPLFWMPMLFLLPLGWVRAREGEPAVVMASLASISLLATTLVFFALVRYRMSYLAAFALLAVAGARTLRASLSARGRTRLATLSPIAIWAACLAGLWVCLAREGWSKVLDWLS